jgi:spore germination cell wall hydrolase CwlJ-like protein
MFTQQNRGSAMRHALALAAVLAALFATAVSAAAEEAPSDRDLACLAEAVYYEARGEPVQGRAAVAYVVLNRAKSGEFPETPCAVVAEGCQFSYRCDGRPESLAVRADRDAAFTTAKAVLTGVVADPTHGALFFHASRIRPGWFESRTRVGKIGNHVFYR